MGTCVRPTPETSTRNCAWAEKATLNNSAHAKHAAKLAVKRVKMDRAKPAEAVLFKAGAFGRDGRAQALDREWLNSTADAVYGSILLRSPSAREIQNLAAYYTQVAEGRPANSVDAAADWVTLSCFAVASSLEAVFY